MSRLLTFAPVWVLASAVLVSNASCEDLRVTVRGTVVAVMNGTPAPPFQLATTGDTVELLIGVIDDPVASSPEEWVYAIDPLRTSLRVGVGVLPLHAGATGDVVVTNGTIPPFDAMTFNPVFGDAVETAFSGGVLDLTGQWLANPVNADANPVHHAGFRHRGR